MECSRVVSRVSLFTGSAASLGKERAQERRQVQCLRGRSKTGSSAHPRPTIYAPNSARGRRNIKSSSMNASHVTDTPVRDKNLNPEPAAHSISFTGRALLMTAHRYRARVSTHLPSALGISSPCVVSPLSSAISMRPTLAPLFGTCCRTPVPFGKQAYIFSRFFLCEQHIRNYLPFEYRHRGRGEGTVELR